ncbi:MULTISPECIES: hypothetical protein [unclassified Streptomyces]|uniref:hypothetical protein n=1 Tax=unclassified Streptomyces TaxID=2593676 RepID=UPI003823C733
MHEVSRELRESRSPKSVLRDRLLPMTIAHADGIPFYRRSWDGPAAPRVTTTGDLAALPVLSRAEVAEHAEQMLHPGRSADLMLHSTGTTTGRPVRRFRSAQEIAALDAFRAKLSQKARDRKGESRPLVHFTTLSARHHGGVLGARTGAHRTVSLSLLTEREVERSLALLAHPGLFPGLAVDREHELSGSPYDLLLLAAVMDETDGAVRERLRRIVSVADFLTRGQQDLLAGMLPPAGRVVHRYSLSEVTGGATRCERCSFFHFDAVVVPEVIPLGGGRPVRSGVGRLVLTELYPFSQAQPLIRYDTGDIVEAVPSDCDDGELSVALLGRAALLPTLPTPEGERLAYRPYPMREALERLPGLARASLVAPARWQRTAGTIPLASCEARAGAGRAPHRLTVRAALAFPPRLLPEAAEATTAHIRAAALGSSPELREMVARSECELRIEVTGDSSAVAPFALR